MKKIVYLAGGMKSGWQNSLLKDRRFKGVKFMDPTSHGLVDPLKYTEWDLSAIRDSDIIFAYFESTNPSGYGLSLELGYARSLNKHIILVDEKSSPDNKFKNMLGMTRSVCDNVFSFLDDGIDELVNVINKTQIKMKLFSVHTGDKECDFAYVSAKNYGEVEKLMNKHNKKIKRIAELSTEFIYG